MQAWLYPILFWNSFAWSIILVLSIDMQHWSASFICFPLHSDAIRVAIVAEGLWLHCHKHCKSIYTSTNTVQFPTFCNNFSMLCIFKGMRRHYSVGKHYRNQTSSYWNQISSSPSTAAGGNVGVLAHSIATLSRTSRIPRLDSGVGASPPPHQACPRFWPAASQAWWWHPGPLGASLPEYKRPEAGETCPHARTSPHISSALAGECAPLLSCHPLRPRSALSIF